ncbi:MAG: hypothetical protein KatS3mg090_0487 [Patescibacteria group bacterium]|nr:MAG: hypothetical protein KatS3mg090_0487 [Patescibacteria group bacterium]
MKKLIVFTISVFVFISSFKVVFASGQYGQHGSPSYNYALIIDKLVINPETGSYVDNLAVSDPKFAPLSYVYFKLVVKNTGNTDLAGVKVIDYLPSYLEYDDDKGQYNAETRELKIEMGDFKVDETKSVIFKARVVSVDKLPANKGVLCLVNKSSVFWENQEMDTDTAQFCVEKKIVPPAKGVEKMPKSGTSIPILSLALFSIGFGLRKRFSV